MVTTAAQYVKGKKRTFKVKLPSLLADGKTHPVFLLRKVGNKDILEVMSDLGVEIPIGKPSEETDKETLREDFKAKIEERVSKIDAVKDLDKMMRRMISNCCVSPRVSLEPTDEKGVLLLDEIADEDQLAIFDALWKESGLSKEAEADRSFPG